MKIYLCFLFLFILTSCISLNDSGYKYDSGYKKYEGKGVIIKNNAITYEYLNGKIGDQKGILKGKLGDTVNLLGYRFRIPGPFVYSLIENKDTIFVSKEDVISLKDYKIRLMPTTFKISKDQDEIVWGRANKYVATHADLKIQIQTNFLIETYSPFKDGQLSYKITRQPLGNEVEFEVSAFKGIYNYYSKDVSTISSYEDAQKCAFFMMYGE
jgi:hypothetical protein